MLDFVEQFKQEVTTRIIPERSRRRADISLLQDLIKLILLVSSSECDFNI
jgi:hypothetical protein